MRDQTAPTPTAASDLREAHGYATRLLISLVETHYPDRSPEWAPLPDLCGVLTQIDNLSTGLVRDPLALAASPASKPDEAPDVVAWIGAEDLRLIVQGKIIYANVMHTNAQARNSDDIGLVPLATLQAERRKHEEAEAKFQRMVDYSSYLQQIIEAICAGRSIPEPSGSARHHYEMAIAYRAAVEGPLDYVEKRRQYWHAEACKENARAEAAETTSAELRAVVERAAEDEREACAKIAAAFAKKPAKAYTRKRMGLHWPVTALPLALQAIKTARAIRARAETEARARGRGRAETEAR